MSGRRGEEGDECLTWLVSRVERQFRTLKLDKLRKLVDSEDFRARAADFAHVPDVTSLFVWESGSGLYFGSSPPQPLRGRMIYFLKPADAAFTEAEALKAGILYGEWPASSLSALQRVVEDVYMPLLSNRRNQVGWTELVAKDVLGSAHSFLASVQIVNGQTEGKTSLPLPPDSVGQGDADAKDQLHLFESCLITWTKQIRAVLRLDPETELKQGKHPGPLTELDFWGDKAANLNSIFAQLQGTRVRRVLKHLDRARSTYNAPFAKLCKEVFQARLEANDNAKLERLESGTEFASLPTLFSPILHLILLVWKTSRHYNTLPRLVVLVREICNALVRNACAYVNGELIFSLMDSEETRQAVNMIQTTLKVCSAFKSTFFEYKAKANTECAENPWRIQNAALFSRMDSFLERCRDLLDFAEVELQFSKLSRIEIGGTKGKTLTTSVHQIHSDFTASVEAFRSVSYDLMDVDAKQFEDDFYEFRGRIKELERRLGSVMTQGFDDCATLDGRFKLLDSFDDLLERPLIKDQLEKKHLALLNSYGEDLSRVNQLFLEHRDDPPIAHNLPPIAGALSWCRGLLERVQAPMEKLKQLDEAIMGREEAREIVKTYTSLVASLAEYEHAKIQEWGSHVEASSQAKLKLSLLARDPRTGLLHVNFDPALVRLLREVKYFLLLGLDVPSTALAVYKKAEVYRRQTGNLDLIVNLYNNMQVTLLPVERPLLRTHATKLEKALSQGLKNLNWKSHGIGGFLTEGMAIAREADSVLSALKGNLRAAQQLMDEWAKEPMLLHTNKPLPLDDFQRQFAGRRKAQHDQVAMGGKEIHRLMKESVRKLKVSTGAPDWRAYVDFVSDIVVQGLTRSLVHSMDYLCNCLDPERIAAEDKMPMIEVDLDLHDRQVRFVPSIARIEDAGPSITGTVDGWIDSFLSIGKAFKRLDAPTVGSYVKDLQEDPEVCMLLASVVEFTDDGCARCNDFRDRFRAYEYLWTTDLQAMFADFLRGAVTEVTQEGEDGEPFKLQVLDLDKFDERIRHFRQVQDEIREMKNHTDIAFLRVNAQPIKQALSTWVTKWVYMFTQHLQEEVVSKLRSLRQFMADVDEGLDTEVSTADKEGLMTIMGHIRDVRVSIERTQAMFQPLRDTAALLKTHGLPLEGELVGDMEALDFLDAAPERWERTVNKTFKCRESIQPLQNQMADTIKKEISSFKSKVSKFWSDFRARAPFAYSTGADDAYRGLDRYNDALHALEEEAVYFHELEELFELAPSKFPELGNARGELRQLKTVWDMVGMVTSLFDSWRRTLWADIDTEDLLEETNALLRQVQRLPKTTRGWGVYRSLEADMRNMATVLPLVSELHSDAMCERHWKQLMQVTNKSFEKGPSFCLDDVLQLNLHEHVDAVSDIVETANKELKIDQKLRKIEGAWDGLRLEFVPYGDGEISALAAPDEVLDTLDDHQLQLQTMAGMGRFVDFFRGRVESWTGTLSTVETVLKQWLSVQRLWASLEAIFLTSTDIRSQLPEDTKRFETLDQEFKDLMGQAVDTPGVVEACTEPGREEVLRNLHRGLEECQRSLNEYLDTKKAAFPRFYFVSNVALLDILSHGNNPPRIMPHLGDCFELQDLTFESQTERDGDGHLLPPNVASAMVAKDGEELGFPEPFHIKGAVEAWLDELVDVMRGSLAHALEHALEATDLWESELPREDWVFHHAAQVVLLASQVTWTEEVEAALDALENDGQEDAVKTYRDTCSKRLEGLIRLVQGNLSREDRNKIITLITIDVHGRDVVSRLIDQRAGGPSDFLWQSQLRYRWDPATKQCHIRITDFLTDYSYEYVGNAGRLVITPLTDRCYITLTMALRLMLGGAPAGPAGTGKTETTKDLARGLGLPCYVFNCSDQMNYQSLADIYKGLTQTGAWGCFDEFNRINLEVLSVVATQVKCVLDAIRYLSVPANRPPEYQHLPAGTPSQCVGTFEFFGSDIRLVPTVGLFITMNPGYAGRSELPENLKALFRSCAMIRPDLEPICENMLMAEGFVKARPLAVKFVTLYQLSSELLSAQAHYDWGLRAVKSVLVVAGMLRRSDREMDEESVLMRALRDFNVPKIVAEDLPVFLRLIGDLFPGMDVPPKVNEDLKDRTLAVCRDYNLVAEDEFVVKVTQFQELLEVRHSVMLLGPAGCGKSTIWQTLARALNVGQSKPVAVYDTVSPKALSSDELYGFMTLAKEWKDGVLSIIMRNMSRNMSPYHDYQSSKWVVLDGDIDAIWIESMNTVMDDNKVLTLVSNERIPLSESMRMLFEIDSLKNATPATVSRAGILYINEDDIGWRPLVESWVAARKDEKERAHLTPLFQRYVPEVVDMLKQHGAKYLVPVPTIACVSTLCHLLEGLLDQRPKGGHSPETVEALFTQAAIWAFGGALDAEKNSDSRTAFSTAWRSQFKGVKFPEGGEVFDYWYDVETGELEHWQARLADFGSSASDVSEQASVTVPTVDTVRLSSMLDLLVRKGHQAMFVGGAGTGKTSLAREYLQAREEGALSSTVNMNFFTDASSLQLQLEQPLDKRSGRVYGPKGSNPMVYFLDDLNMPRRQTYGTQTTSELVRQWMDYGAWFDRGDASLKKSIVDVQFIACMNHKAGSFSITPRLQRHFATFALRMPPSEVLTTIYSTILLQHLGPFPQAVQRLAPTLVAATIELHHTVSEKFLPSAVRFHYNWNLREMSHVFHGLLRATPEHYDSPPQLLRLWLHEAERVFSDRLIEQAETNRMEEILRDVFKKYFEDADADKLFARPLLFTAFSTAPDEIGGGDDSEGAYLPVKEGDDGRKQVRRALESKLEDYNETNTIMNLVLFGQAVEHVCRIARILSTSRGSALLVGVGGSGKQSLTRLASFICGYSVVQLSVTSDYTETEFRESLKDLYRKAGVKPAVPLVFLLNDSQVVDERFLIYVNDLLSSGVIPDLFSAEEYDGLFSSLRPAAKAAAVPESRDSMMDFFIGRVRDNLHVVLAFSPVGDVFRTRARRFPALVNCTVIDWFRPWPKDALVSVASSFLGDVELGAEDILENVAHHMAEVHTSVNAASERFRAQQRRYNYTTPKSFLELVAFFKRLLADKRHELNGQVRRLDVGLSTLQKTADQVAGLQEELKSTMVRVEERRAATEELLEEMGRQRGEAEKQQEAASVEKEKASKAAEEASRIEGEAESELADAKPMMEAARDAVNCLDKASLTELKGFTKPPSGVDQVTTAVMMMVRNEKRDFSWDKAKKMMARVDAFKKSLEDYDAETIPEEVVARVDPIIADKEFDAEKMQKKSVAATNLLLWVVNVISYHKIYKKVKPLMDSLEVARQEKQAAETELEKALAVVRHANESLAKLQKDFLAATNAKAKVEAEAAACRERLDLAERLVTGLSSEKERWGNEVSSLGERKGTLVGDCLLSAAFVSYIGAFDNGFRHTLWRETWLPDLESREIPLRMDVSPLDILASEGRIAEWMNERLPADPMSIENGAIITNCDRWPLLIDPQLQGVRWLKTRVERAEGATLVVLSITKRDWARRLMQAIREGATVIIEGLGEELDATLEPVLARSFTRRGKSLFLTLGSEEVEYDPAFQLFLQTKLSNPHYKPEVAAQCTLINFIVTEQGLEDQLLARVVNREEPELEARKQELQEKFNEHKIQLLDLENQLLERLANAPDDILSDVALIEGLEATKKTVMEINEAVRSGEEASRQTNEAREKYRPVAAEGSLLYFILTTLCNIDHMYQYSLDSFVGVFFRAMETAEEKDDSLARVEALRDSVRVTVVTWTSRGLFERHKLILLAQLLFALMKKGMAGEDSGYSDENLSFLLRGPSDPDAENPVEWMPDPAWSMLQALSQVEGFERLPSDLEESAPRFQEWFNQAAPESEKLPLDWRELDKEPFRKLLVVRCLRPDRIPVALGNVVRAVLPGGERFTSGDASRSNYQILEETFATSRPETPLYFILSPGADVVADVDRLARAKGFERGVTYHNISLGQGQDVVAMERLEAAHNSGHWVLLNNVHLMPRWLVELEKRLDEFAEEGSHESFRLFLSSDPSADIPISLLSRCIKLTNEPPSGLKANLRRALQTLPADEVEEMDTNTRGILFGLCFFHAVMIERKKFGPMGFNIAYPFSLQDLQSSVVVLRNYMDSVPTKVPWADLRYVFGEIMYGGHIVNDFDRLLCNKYLEYFVSPDLFDESFEMMPYCKGQAGDDSFHPPPSSHFTLAKMAEHVEASLPEDTPLAYGLHPNAEIGFRTDITNALFDTILELQPREGADAEGGQSPQGVVEQVLQDVMEEYRGFGFDLDEVKEAWLEEGPFQSVFLQECKATNALVAEMTRSLGELELGFRGELTMTDAMESLQDSIFLDRVPPAWAALACPSTRPLPSWLQDLKARISQLQDIVADGCDAPRVTWLPGLFSPQALLTAVKQVTAQRISLELDKLRITTDLLKKDVSELDSPSRDGAYIHGLFLEGARFDSGTGSLATARPKEMFCPLPVINCRAVALAHAERGVYSCPVYRTPQRGPTYVFSATLKTHEPTAKWVLAGVAILMEVQ